MIKKYFKIAWRNLVRNKVMAFINIGGLAVAIAFMTIGFKAARAAYANPVNSLRSE